MEKTDKIIQELNSFVQEYATNSELVAATAGQKINSTQAHLLMLLKILQSQTNTELAAAMNLSKPAITKAIKNLKRYHYVTAVVDDSDKRSTHYLLTEDGEKLAQLHEQAHATMHDDIHTIMADFTQEQQQTITQFLTKLNKIGNNS
ncbi:MarR family transcriptional regulator [Leuconostoc mesenteroides]|uniref:MarR family transcriptional regulator n=1 Tax=Leuconostoc mesenteroides TaxID=1245 RepID=UPI0020744987|nr:MarR family transcriptional regulator [Leuconostoc mesenteroides]MCM6833403.1 MarR family transcriptional regulator [Leuconostoc mesenteroides]